ncbi:MAG: hypothetical protein A2487_15195 [Candidatus Raymondbacteria bacterium RifOxyC12_full_50_8]|uniref:Uncharacterized protein n=1 Tax=Candidatus Raymondbacteria bacterium RIFOXYD12_FULL_49_13 TaxID=1817890 RepID=A0A1F7FK78_UNCRA|nr:MAG: hypothetical protein A2350_10585 [Candidatus Raymondbacteria bacterium RifOxyB12_full_50_8]OGJ91983.1 MAG: hypothetical protein A2248_09415 [Candidatus Raymondbacteria bacterium RIFOXYA2_FULL_49_16]OGJ96349.1 MAG: hypothetical protein A2453_08475 [Candidatus Raymondbacteria bacterium RIFOXYC2_FULL_50_21]OGK03716.1 MAG: hypothetical protein A2487_15195 [Candidatus Raymondbacteria bacterium RifOxyC12_full_50_8]OGK06886.1 MAG: hypothetical protein A2519_11545 [Candidatus Raymondbacteria ba
MASFNAGLCTIQHALNLLEKEGLIKGVPSQGIFVRDPEELLLHGTGRQIRDLRQTKLPLVHCEPVDFKSSSPMVLADHFHGGKIAAQQMAKLGHKWIVFLHGHKKSKRETDQTNKLRWQGIQAGVKSANIAACEEFISMDLAMDTEMEIDTVVQKAMFGNACRGDTAGRDQRRTAGQIHTNVYYAEQPDLNASVRISAARPFP